MKNRIGIIADDFTGAGDAASFIRLQYSNVFISSGLTASIPEDIDVVIVALKIRSINADEAVQLVKEAIIFLKENNCNKFYFKFCSTFDSTPKGNIGPIMDSLIDCFNLPYSVLCPSLPLNGRTVKDGILYVNGVELEKSPLKNHPLNPMWNSYIPNLMKPQSQYPCYVLSRDNFQFLDQVVQKLRKKGKPFYLVPDYENDMDGKLLAPLLSDHEVIGGGSGLLEYLWSPTEKDAKICCKIHSSYKKSLILCGSCSLQTRKQVNYFKENNGITREINVESIVDLDCFSDDIFHWIQEQTTTVLLYSSALYKNMGQLKKRSNFLDNAKRTEMIMQKLSRLALNSGFDRIIVGGGETSGAVLQHLKYKSFYVGETISPGVPVLIPTLNRQISFILKSGNFGEEDFFIKCLKK